MASLLSDWIRDSIRYIYTMVHTDYTMTTWLHHERLHHDNMITPWHDYTMISWWHHDMITPRQCDYTMTWLHHDNMITPWHDYIMMPYTLWTQPTLFSNRGFSISTVLSVDTTGSQLHPPVYTALTYKPLDKEQLLFILLINDTCLQTYLFTH